MVESYTPTLYAGQVEPIRLKHNMPNSSVKKIGDKEYTFRRINVKQESECLFFAMDDPDDKYDETYADAVVAMTLFGEVSLERIKEVQHIDVAIYYYAFFYQMYLPHGIDVRTELACDKCNKTTVVLHPIKASLNKHRFKDNDELALSL